MKLSFTEFMELFEGNGDGENVGHTGKGCGKERIALEVLESFIDGETQFQTGDAHLVHHPEKVMIDQEDINEVVEAGEKLKQSIDKVFEVEDDKCRLQ